MREVRELQVQPEPLPAGLRFVPPRLPPAPPATGASGSPSSPELYLVALLAPCYHEAVTIGALLQRWEAYSATGQEAPEDLLRDLEEWTRRLRSRLGELRKTASRWSADDAALRAFQARLQRLRPTREETSGERQSRRAIRDCLIAGATAAGFHDEELATDEFWTCPATDTILALPPTTCLFYLISALVLEVADPAVLSGSQRFRRTLYRRVAAMLLAALEAATLRS